MNRHFFIWLLLTIAFTSGLHAQGAYSSPIGNLVYVQSANFADLKSWAEKIGRNASDLKIDPFKTVLAQHNDVQNGTYEDLRVDVVMYDPFRIGSRKLKKPNPMTADEYIRSWNERVTGDRVLFFFQKPSRDADEYAFKRLEASPELKEKQLPEIITTYIEKNILAKAGNAQETLKAGINALKNAFDQQFKQRLVEIGPEELSKDIYKVNFVNWGPQYTYELIANHENINIDSTAQFTFIGPETFIKPDFLNTYELISNEKYFDWSNITKNPDKAYPLKIDFLRFPRSIYNAMLTSNPTLSDTAINNLLSIINTQYKDTIFYYPSSLLTYFPSQDNKGNVFHSRKFLDVEIKRVTEDQNHIEVSNDNINGLNVHTTSREISNLRLRNRGCKLKFNLKTINAGDSINLRDRDILQGRSTTNNGEYIKSITWCNKYVVNMSKIIFPLNKRNYGLWNDELSANNIYINLKNNTDFLRITTLKNSSKWNLVNEGFIMFISYYSDKGSGHIELGWPDDNGITEMTIGAGKLIGKKSFASSRDKRIKMAFPGCDPEKIEYYIYLGYLKSDKY